MTVTKDTIIGDILDYDRETAQFFLAIGMHCLGCPASRGESMRLLAPFTARMLMRWLKRSTLFLPQRTDKTNRTITRTSCGLFVEKDVFK